MNSLTKFFIPKDYQPETAIHNRAVLIVNIFLATTAFSIAFTWIGYYTKYQLSSQIMPIGPLVMVLLLFLAKKKVNLDLLGNIFALLGSVLIIMMITYSGGIYSPLIPWTAAGPIFTLLMISRKAAWVWLIMMFAVLITFFVLELYHKTPEVLYDISTKATYYLISYISFIFILVMVYLFFEKNKNDALQKAEVANFELKIKNKNITDSINYAQRIQTAILPSDKEVNDLFPGSFILFKPKDIISGDFYWTAQGGDKNFIAVADCTGHGVPGALMSMIGNELLNKIIYEKKICSVDEILNVLHTDLCFVLKQSSTDVKDGMDIVLCSINNKTKEIEYAGAKNPLYVFTNNELHVVKASREAIGGDNQVRQYSKHNVPNARGTKLYLCSDGFQDQFGGESGKKFQVGKLKRIFQEVSRLETEEQKSALLSIFQNWKGVHEQTDDVLIIGITI